MNTPHIPSASRKWGERCHKDLFILESSDPPSLMLYHLLEELPSMVSGTLAHSQRKQEVSGEYRMRRRECVGEGQAKTFSFFSCQARKHDPTSFHPPTIMKRDRKKRVSFIFILSCTLFFLRKKKTEDLHERVKDWPFRGCLPPLTSTRLCSCSVNTG